ncbi:MAG: hypothetical protein ACXVYI_01375 [Mycobacterium sp.]
MTVTAMTVTGRWHRLAATGSGYGRLTATKALKRVQMDVTDALVFLTRIGARGTAHVVNQPSLWLLVIPITAATLTAVCLLLILLAALTRERKRAMQRSLSTATDSCGVRSELRKAG